MGWCTRVRARFGSFSVRFLDLRDGSDGERVYFDNNNNNSGEYTR